MKLFSRILPYVTAACLLLLIGILAWQCVDIYFFSPASDASVYTYTDVSARLKSLLPLAVASVLMILITACVHPPKATKHSKSSKTQHKEACIKATVSSRPLMMVRSALVLLAGVFILWGVLNGGLYDVFVKAINICTECIGLG